MKHNYLIFQARVFQLKYARCQHGHRIPGCVDVQAYLTSFMTHTRKLQDANSRILDYDEHGIYLNFVAFKVQLLQIRILQFPVFDFRLFDQVAAHSTVRALKMSLRIGCFKEIRRKP